MIAVVIAIGLAGLIAAIVFIVRGSGTRAGGGHAGDGTTGGWIGSDSGTGSDASCGGGGDGDGDGDGGGGGGDGGGGGGDGGGGCD